MKSCPGLKLHLFHHCLEQTKGRMTALTPEAFKFKLGSGNWQCAAACAGSLLDSKRGSVQRQQFSPPRLQKIRALLTQFEHGLVVKQKPEWKGRKAVVTAIRIHGCMDEICTETKSWTVFYAGGVVKWHALSHPHSQSVVGSKPDTTPFHFLFHYHPQQWASLNASALAVWWTSAHRTTFLLNSSSTISTSASP